MYVLSINNRWHSLLWSLIHDHLFHSCCHLSAWKQAACSSLSLALLVVRRQLLRGAFQVGCESILFGCVRKIALYFSSSWLQFIHPVKTDFSHSQELDCNYVYQSFTVWSIHTLMPSRGEAAVTFQRAFFSLSNVSKLCKNSVLNLLHWYQSSLKPSVAMTTGFQKNTESKAPAHV